MPEAIATTKRKFYKALDSLNNPPATRPTEPVAKRVRRSVTTTSTTSRNTVATTDTKKDDGTPKPPPNFSPWSHETFLARLKTYSSVSLWHPKPEAISEVEWAKRGWVCAGVNTVACKGGCEKRVVVILDVGKQPNAEDNTSEEADGAEAEDETANESAMEDALVARYKALIVNGHADICLWHKAGCTDDIYHLQVVRPSVWQPELSKRYQSLRAIDDAARDIKVKSLPHDTSASLSPERLMADLPAVMLGPDHHSASPESLAKALEVALHGWRGSKDSGNELFQCDACFQRVGLWMYQPNYKASRPALDDGEQSSATVDLVELHRDHCPWRNPNTQKASGSLSGLNASQILQRVISTYAREQRRKSDEQSKSAQQLEAEEAQAEEEELAASPVLSREEVAKQDTERESRLRKLKSMFTIKRKSAMKPANIAKMAK